MKREYKLQDKIKLFLCGMSLILTGCSAIGLAQDSSFESAYENVPEKEDVDIYTSGLTAVIETVDEAEGTITVFSIDHNEERTFTYNGGCTVSDKYGNPMSMAQLKPGDIADISYNSELERVGRISLTSDVFSQEGVEKYTLNLKGRNVTIGDTVYSLNEKVLVYSEGKRIEPEEILHNDVLSFYGRGNKILSITVDKGHGYLELENDENFLGGWIEVGQAVICQIQPDMLITVPEGTYTVRLTAGEVEELRLITIERNRETLVDVGNVKFPEAVNSRVIFQITPENAVVYVDDEEVNTDYVMRLPFGIHRITAEASGYDTLSEYFNIEGEATTIKMTLTESSSVSGNNIAKADESANITIDVPQEVEVYQDNIYKGIATVTYEKTAGTHTITLRKSGYVTKSYEIQVPDDDTDVTYTFPALDPESETVSGNALKDNTVNSAKENVQTLNDNTVSGNSVSGNSTAQ